MYTSNSMAKALIVAISISPLMYGESDLPLMRLLKPLINVQKYQYGQDSASAAIVSAVKHYFSLVGVDSSLATVNKLANASQPRTVVAAELSGIWVDETDLAALPEAQQKFFLAESVVSYVLQHPVKYGATATGIGLLGATPLIASNIKVINSVASNPTTLRYIFGGIAAFAAHKLFSPLLSKFVSDPLIAVGGKVFEQESISATAKLLAQNGEAWIIDDYMKLLQSEIGSGNGNKSALNFYASNSDVFGWLNAFSMEWKTQSSIASQVESALPEVAASAAE